MIKKEIHSLKENQTIDDNVTKYKNKIDIKINIKKKN